MIEYFKNLVENPNEYKSDIVHNTLTILEEAKMWAERSMDMFTRSQETDNEALWHACIEHDKRARGLLDAYQIITGREVVNIVSAIRQEIDVYKVEFLVD